MNPVQRELAEDYRRLRAIEKQHQRACEDRAALLAFAGEAWRLAAEAVRRPLDVRYAEDTTAALAAIRAAADEVIRRVRDNEPQPHGESQ